MHGGGTPTRQTPQWLRALGVFALVAIAGSMAFAIAIGAANFARIGV